MADNIITALIVLVIVLTVGAIISIPIYLWETYKEYHEWEKEFMSKWDDAEDE